MRYGEIENLIKTTYYKYSNKILNWINFKIKWKTFLKKTKKNQEGLTKQKSEFLLNKHNNC